MLSTVENVAGSNLITRDPERAAAAHLLRRTALAVRPERVDELASMSWSDAVAAVLDQPGASGQRGSSGGKAPATEHWTDTTDWWIDRMAAADSGLTDRLAWFWHGLLTTNAYKVSANSFLAEQLDHLRTNATGNYRTLLHGYVTGGALLEYLEASHSVASNPNENLARELMELFTVGRGNYNEDDVRAAARALAGWVVEDDEVQFRRENAFVAPLIYLGEQAEWDTTMIVDRLCDHPATATRIASRLWDHLVGVPLTDAAATDLGDWWRAQDLEILPLVERILNDPTFASSSLSRPRGALEWYCAARSVLGFDDESWYLENLGQMPYLPPSVAGWPNGTRWLAPGPLLSRASFIHSIDLGEILRRSPGSTSASRTEDILDRCSLFEVSPQTVEAIAQVANVPDISPESTQLVRWRLALTSPEFNLT
ncbi:MAG: DUF1800 family protein [Acidimicrobiales bacterium]